MRIFRWKRTPKPTFDAPLAPSVPVCVIGDIHGRADLLARLLERLAATVPPQACLVFVGDFVDRGDQSREVLETLWSLQQERTGQAICLMGNHERMLLDFLDEPVAHGARWMRHGGLQTLASYRVGPAAATAEGADWIAVRDWFREELGETEPWLRTLPLTWQSGNLAVVHAAVDPALALEDQSESVLLWGHPEFGKTLRTDGIWVAHGHTIIDQPRAEHGRISVDTGAYATGTLTAAFINEGMVTFL